MNDDVEGRTGWLAGVRDRVVGAALKHLHSAPSAEWTLQNLAQESGTSRSVLADRFQTLVGVTPMHYLTQLRMLLAANMLRRGTAPIGQIAEEVGYQTDSAFSRAFRREYGCAPAAWRRGQSSNVASNSPAHTAGK
jgi:AraC-like DNA-binding protein